MSRFFRVNLGLVLALALLAAPAAAAPKAGTSCSKSGSTVVSNGMKYTCIKNGKKLVWNKGVKVVTPKIQPTTSPTPESVKPASKPFPQSPETDKLDQLVANALKNGRPVNATVDLQVGPGKEVAVLGEIAKNSLDSALLIAGVLGIEFSKPVKAYVGTREWLIPKMPAGTWCSDPVIGVPGSGSGGFCGIDSGVIFISIDGYLDEPGSSKRDFSTNPDKIMVSFGFVHEMVHWMQAEATQKYAKMKGFYNPYWLNEGGANFAAMMAQAYLYKVPFSKVRTYIATYSNCIYSADSIKMKDYIRNAGQRNNCGPYYAGYLWSEYLVAATGDLGALINLAKQNAKVGSEVQWDANKPDQFEQDRLAVSLKYQYGIEFDSFVSGAESYSMAASKALGIWFKENPQYWPTG